MQTRSVPGLVLDEAADVLGDLADWLRAASACPRCSSLRGCSHDAGCPLGRIVRLRNLLASDDEKLRDEDLAALARERGAAAAPAAAAKKADSLPPTVRAGAAPTGEGGAT